jgi:hypothetical protein
MRAPFIVRLSSRPWAAGGQIAFDVSGLDAHPPMDAPELQGLRLRWSGTIHVAAGKTVRGRVLVGNVMSRFFANDAFGQVVNMSTYSLRQWAQRILGSGYADPPDIVNGGGAADFAADVELFIPFENRKSQMPSDYRKPVSDLSGQGGQMRIQCASGTITNSDGSTTSSVNNDGTLEIWGNIIDAGTKSANSRLQLVDYAVTGQDFRYSVMGLLLESWLSEQPSDIDVLTGIAAQSIISSDLGYASYDSQVLDDTYRNQLFSPSAADDVLVGGVAHSLYASGNYQSLMELPDLETVQWRFGTTVPTNGIIVIASVTQRAPVQVAAALGVAAAALPAIESAAKTDGKDGGTSYAGLGKAATFLPVYTAGAKAA